MIALIKAGIWKVLMEAIQTKRVFVTPEIKMYTAPKRCPGRNLSCFFQPIPAPTCQKVTQIYARDSVVERRWRVAGGRWQVADGDTRRSASNPL